MARGGGTAFSSTFPRRAPDLRSTDLWKFCRRMSSSCFCPLRGSHSGDVNWFGSTDQKLASDSSRKGKPEDAPLFQNEQFLQHPHSFGKLVIRYANDLFAKHSIYRCPIPRTASGPGGIVQKRKLRIHSLPVRRR